MSERRIILLRKLTTLLLALVVMVVMAVPAYGAPSCSIFGDVVVCNNGHQLDDSLDHDKGGGNDHNKVNNGKGND